MLLPRPLIGIFPVDSSSSEELERPIPIPCVCARDLLGPGSLLLIDCGNKDREDEDDEDDDDEDDEGEGTED